MQSQDSQIFESYVPVYDVIPDKWEEARPFVVEQLKKISQAVNVREIGFFLDEEVLSGKAFIPSTTQLANGQTNQQFRQVLRKVIDFGPLPNGVIPVKSVPHGINIDSNFTLIFLNGAASNPTTLQYLPLPYATPPTINANILLNMDAMNVNIVTNVNVSAFTRCFVTIEYLQEL